jgi:hypothetical protein
MFFLNQSRFISLSFVRVIIHTLYNIPSNTRNIIAINHTKAIMIAQVNILQVENKIAHIIHHINAPTNMKTYFNAKNHNAIMIFFL